MKTVRLNISLSDRNDLLAKRMLIILYFSNNYLIAFVHIVPETSPLVFFEGLELVECDSI